MAQHPADRFRNIFNFGRGASGWLINGSFLSTVDYGAMLNLPLPSGFYLSSSFLFELAICLSVLGSVFFMLNTLGHPEGARPNPEKQWRSLMELLTAIAIGILFGVGIYQMLRRNVIRSAIGLIILSSAINLFLLSTGAYLGVEPAYDGATLPSDALPQALILTAIVISMGAWLLYCRCWPLFRLGIKPATWMKLKG